MLKVIWAEQHISQLNLALTAFANNTPHFSLKPNPKHTEGYTLYPTVNEIPIQFSLMAGDIVNNLRSALDCAWMGLVRSSGTSKKHTIPIADNKKGLEGMIYKAPIGGAVNQAKILLVERMHSHRDIDDGGSPTLMILNKLSNWNKHNMIGLAFGRLDMKNATIRINDKSVLGFKDVSLVGHGPMFHYSDATSDKLNYEGEVSFDVIFDEVIGVDEHSIIPFLNQALKYCIQSLNAFCEIFPSEHNPTFAELMTPLSR